MTKGEIVYGLLDAYGINSDDSLVYPSHAQMYLDMARNKAILEYLKQNGQSLPPGVLLTLTCQEIKQSDCEQYIELEHPVLDLPDDIGFYSLSFAGANIPKEQRSGRANLVAQTRFAEKTYCYREGNRIILKGRFNKALKAKITFVPSSTDFLDDDDYWPIPDSFAPEIWNDAMRMMSGNAKNPPDLISDSKAEPNG